MGNRIIFNKDTYVDLEIIEQQMMDTDTVLKIRKWVVVDITGSIDNILYKTLVNLKKHFNIKSRTGVIVTASKKQQAIIDTMTTEKSYENISKILKDNNLLIDNGYIYGTTWLLDIKDQKKEDRIIELVEKLIRSAEIISENDFILNFMLL